MKKKGALGIGLIGCGRIASKHLAVIADIEGAEVTAVCDTDEEKAARMAGLLGVRSFSRVEDILTDNAVDVVDILTPSGFHAEIGIAAARHGKHVIVEKPLAMSLSEADRLIEECNRNSVMLFEIKQNRYNVPVRKLREAIKRGRFGKLLLGTIRVRWHRGQDYYDQAGWRGTKEQGGGVLTNQANHHVDLLQWLMGPVRSVMAKAATFLYDIEVANTAVAILTFMNGALGIIEATTVTRPTDLEGSISLLGEGGSVVIGGFAANRLETWNFIKKLPEDDEIFTLYGRNPAGDKAYAHREMLRSIVSSINGEGEELINGSEAKKSLELIHALNESARTGREVFLPCSSGSGLSWL